MTYEERKNEVLLTLDQTEYENVFLVFLINLFEKNPSRSFCPFPPEAKLQEKERETT